MQTRVPAWFSKTVSSAPRLHAQPEWHVSLSLPVHRQQIRPPQTEFFPHWRRSHWKTSPNSSTHNVDELNNLAHSSFVVGRTEASVMKNELFSPRGSRRDRARHFILWPMAQSLA